MTDHKAILDSSGAKEVGGTANSQQASVTVSRCPDCSVLPGSIHLFGCDVEQCPACGGQRLACGCRTKRKSLPWTGEWPGVAECREFGWYAYCPGNGTGWHCCGKDHPGAREDLNRLYVEAKWNAKLGRFCRKEGVAK